MPIVINLIKLTILADKDQGQLNMMKTLAAFLIILSLGTYFYYYKNKSYNYSQNDAKENLSETKSPNTNANILTQKSLHQAFEKILEKEQARDHEDKRTPASQNENTPSTPNNQVAEDSTTANMPEEEDFEAEFTRLSPQEQEAAVYTLQTDIKYAQNQLDHMEETKGKNVDEQMINEVSQSLQNKQDKLDFFMTRMNTRKEQ